MIVDSMTHEEVYDELARDREAMTRWWRHTLDAQRRRVLKSTRFPVHMWFDYTSPRKIRYLFFTRMYDKRMKRILTGIAVLRRMADGITIYTDWLDDQMLIRPMVLIPHFWKQYAARANVPKSGIELIRHYFEHNAHGKDTHNQRVVGRSVRWNGEEHQSCCVPDGVLLGQVYGDIYVVKTFITYDMCSGIQEKEFASCREQILTDRNLYDIAMECYNY